MINLPSIKEVLAACFAALLIVPTISNAVPITASRYDDPKGKMTITEALSVNQLGYYRGSKKSVDLYVQRTLEDITNNAYTSYALDINGSSFQRIELNSTNFRRTAWGSYQYYTFDFSSFEGGTYGGQYTISLMGKKGNIYTAITNSPKFYIYGTTYPGGVTPLVNQYQSLAKDAYLYYNFHRIGTPAMQNTNYARQSLHGQAVPCFKDWCGNGVVASTDLKIGAGTGWADAGDFGLYPVNHAMAAWQLLNAEEFKLKFGTFYRLGNPGSEAAPADVTAANRIKIDGSVYSTLVDETIIGSSFMLDFQTLLDTATVKLAPHRITDMDWGQGFGAWCIDGAGSCKTQEAQVVPSAEVTTDRIANYKRRSAAPGSTAATYAVCRTAAHIARFVQRDSTKTTVAAKWMKLAQSAVKQADANPVRLFPAYYVANNFSAIPDGGGPYADENIEDDKFSCYAEIYLAALQFGGSSASDSTVRTTYTTYRQKLTTHPLFTYLDNAKTFDWKNVAPMAYMSLVVAKSNDLNSSDMIRIKDWLKVNGSIASNSVVSGLPDYPVNNYQGEDPNPLWNATGHTWGSNSNVLNAGVLVTYASMLYKEAGQSAEKIHNAQGALKTLDYIFGQNGLRMSFVTGYGYYAETDTHDRWAWYLHTKDPRKLAYPAGWVSGGPTGDLIGCFSGTENRVVDGSEPWERATPFFFKAINSTSTEGWIISPAAGVNFDAKKHGRYNPFAKVYSDSPSGTLLSAEGAFKLLPNASQMVKDNAEALATFNFRAAYVPRPSGWESSKNHDMNYAAPETAPDAWCSKENTINYNSALLWMATAAQSALPGNLR